MPRSNLRVSLLFLIWIFCFPNLALAEDWPGWRGADRTDVSRETGLLKTWPDGGPQRIWLSNAAGVGYSGFAVVGDKLFTIGAYDDAVDLLCLNANTGKFIWSTTISESVLSNGWGDGPRGTPTVDGEYVYAMSGEGDLICAKAENGEKVWSVAMRDFGGKIPNWGYTESVLVDGDKVICTPGGSDGAIVALNKRTGETIWRSTDFTNRADYASIIVADHFDKRQYIQLTQRSLIGVSSEDGSVLWKTSWPGRTAVIPTPIFQDGKVYATSGYGAGCKLLKLTGSGVKEVYSNKTMKNHHGGVILFDGHLYGYSDNVGWLCQNFETGEKVWAERGALGKGAIACADGMLYCLGEDDGEMVLIDASTKGWSEKGRFTLDPQTEFRSSRGKIWTHPVIANGKLYLRDQELVFCFDIKNKSS